MLSKVTMLSEIIDINNSVIVFKDSKLIIYEVFRGNDKEISIPILAQNIPLTLDLVLIKSRYTDEEVDLYIKKKIQNIQSKNTLHANLKELNFERKVLKDSFLLRTYFVFQVNTLGDIDLIDRLFKESGINVKRLSSEEIMTLITELWM